MNKDNDWVETRDKKGHAMVPATPRDVVVIRVSSFILVFLFALAVLGAIAQAWVMTGIAVVLAVLTALNIWRAVKKQKDRDVGEAG
jgi:phosphoglycerol transferase MdoB-like AlkP superfamily enzyme